VSAPGAYRVMVDGEAVWHGIAEEHPDVQELTASDVTKWIPVGKATFQPDGDEDEALEPFPIAGHIGQAGGWWLRIKSGREDVTSEIEEAIDVGERELEGPHATEAEAREAWALVAEKAAS